METLKVYERVSQHFSQNEKRTRKVEELNMFLSNPNDWINSIELQVNQYLETSENPYKKYAKLAFDRAMEKYKNAKKSTFPELMLQ